MPGTPVRYPFGVSTAKKTWAMADLGIPDPTSYHVFLDDFDRYVAAHWTVTEVGTGSRALTAGDGGLLLLTCAAADDNSEFLQNTVASFLPTPGKKLFFKARLKVSDATQSDVQIGLVITDTTPLDATDGIYFMKDDGDAQIDIICRKNATTGSTTATNVGTLVSDTFITLAFMYDGKSKARFFINDRQVGILDASSTYLPDAALAVTISIQNGEAVAKTMTVDYLFAAQER